MSTEAPDRVLHFAYSMRAKIKRRQPLNILLVEDDAADARLAACALDETRIHYRLDTVRSGDEAMQYLQCEDQFAGKPPPDLILLDLTLPHKDGFEVLAELTAATGFGRIPIIILTGSNHYRDIMSSCNVWLSDYLEKPCNPDRLMEAFSRLHSPAQPA